MNYPIFAPSSTWYSQGGTTVEKTTFTEITILDSYTPTGEESESWNADVNNNGDIKCYIKGTKLIIAGNGSGKLALNEDSSYMFSNEQVNMGFTKVEYINGLDILDTSNTITMLHMFHSCYKLKDISINNFDTSHCTNFLGMFGLCEKLTQIIGIDKIDTSNVTSFGSMFQGCEYISELDLTNFDTKKGTNMFNMFDQMVRLKKIALGSNFNFSGKGTASLKAQLPSPSSRYIIDTDGRWHSEDCITYTSNSIPNETKMTYYAVPVEVPTTMTIKYGTMFNIAESYRQRAEVNNRVSPSALASGIKSIPGFKIENIELDYNIDNSGYIIINKDNLPCSPENIVYITARFDGETGTRHIMTHEIDNGLFYYTYENSNQDILVANATESAIIGSSNSISWPIDPNLIYSRQLVWITTIGYIG